MVVGKGSSSSKRIKVFTSKRVNEKRSHTEMLLNPKAARIFREHHHEQLQSKLEAMNNEERQAFENARDVPDSVYDNDNDLLMNNIDDILDGSARMDLSHAGGEFQQILEEGLPEHRHTRLDPRTRRDRTERRTQGFMVQLEDMIVAYMTWQASLKDGCLDSMPVPPPADEVEGLYRITVMDVFRSYSLDAPLKKSDKGVAPAIVQQGLIPCAPFSPTLAFSTWVIELYRNNHLRCPHLAIQPFVKGLCDLHRVPFRPYLSQQFSICYDLYLSIREGVTQCVDTALDRSSPNWRLRNACAACCYKLKDEPAQIFEMLVTMDGNDSLKRILRRWSSREDGHIT